MSEPLTPTDSTPAPTQIDATTGQIIKPTIIQTIVADAESLFVKVDDEFRAVEASLGFGVATSAPVVFLTSTAPSPNIITKVGELLALSGRTPVAFSEITALALASAASGDIDVVLAKLKDLVAYSGTNTDVWDKVVAVAKAL